MQLLLRDPSYTDRLASFFRSLGLEATIAGPGEIELGPRTPETTREEIAIYLRVWNVLCPEAEVTIR
jgi:hypothetical protein